MFAVTSAAPQFLVEDFEKSLGFYRDVLGFNIDFVFDDYYAGISLGGGIIHIKRAQKIEAERQHRKAQEHLDAYFAVRNLEALNAELIKRDAPIIRAIDTRPWGMRDLYVEDPEGYILCFAEPA